MMETIVQPGQRGKFYQPAASVQAPVQLDERVHAYLSERARCRGVSLDDLVNDLLKKSIELSWRLAG
jgi:hypothetical protein